MLRPNPDLDPEALAAAFRGKRRLHIPNFLVREDADRLYESLKQDDRWRVVIKQGRDRHEFPTSLTLQQKDQLSLLARRAHPDSLQFRFDFIPVPESARERAEKPNALHAFNDFMCSDRLISFFRTVTGVREIGFADAQGTAYGTGDFLGEHNDEIAGLNRHAAYVMNLSPGWRVDWGGLLMFPDASGHVQEAFAPVYNSLNLFAVPQNHSVSIVAPFAGDRRYAVSGWLRSGPAPA